MRTFSFLSHIQSGTQSSEACSEESIVAGREIERMSDVRFQRGGEEQEQGQSAVGKLEM